MKSLEEQMNELSKELALSKLFIELRIEALETGEKEVIMFVNRFIAEREK